MGLGAEGPCANVLTALLCSPELARRTKRVRDAEPGAWSSSLPFLLPLISFNIFFFLAFFFFFNLTPCIVNLTGFGFWRAKPRERSLPFGHVPVQTSWAEGLPGLEKRSDCLRPMAPARRPAWHPPAASTSGTELGKASDVSDGLSGQVNSLWPWEGK